MNVERISAHLRGNPESVITLLHSVGIEQISRHYATQHIRFAREPGRNPSSILFNLQTLKYHCFSTGERGDIYSFLMDKCALGFFCALRYVVERLGLEEAQLQETVKLPFGGFYRKLSREAIEPESLMQVYDDAMLAPYANKFNLLFQHDGVSFDTQAKFGVGYDHESDRITIPMYSLEGRLCGIMGRLNDKSCPKEARYLPIIPCSRSLTLYGYHQNYAAIQRKGLCVVVEAEKGVMQMDSFGCQIGLSTSGSSISATQARYIKALLLPRIILAYDEGLPEDKICEEAAKLKSDNPIYQNRVGYVFDRDHEILTLAAKQSPTDLGKAAFSALMQRHVTWL